MQGEWYTADPFGTPGFQAFDSDKALAEHPEYITFNGHVDALTEFHPLQAEVGETVRIFFGVGGPNIGSNFHVIGEIFDKVYSGSPNTFIVNEETSYVPPGSVSTFELTLNEAGDYLLVDHALYRVTKAQRGYYRSLNRRPPREPSPSRWTTAATPAAASGVSTLHPSTTVPARALPRQTSPSPAAATHDLMVTYTDDTAVKVSMLGTGDIRVTGPSGYDVTATYIGVDIGSDGTPRTATYRISAPGGTWDNDDDGTYVIELLTGEVTDTAGNAAAHGVLGAFEVTTNAAPIVTTSVTTLSYTEDDPAVVIDPTLSITDVVDTLLEGATVSISAAVFQPAKTSWRSPTSWESAATTMPPAVC